MPRLRPVRSFHLAALELDLEHNLCIRLVIVLVLQLIQLPLLCHFGTDHDDVVPGGASQRLRCFLQPGIVEELAIVNAWIRTEADLIAISARWSGRQGAKFSRDLSDGESGIRDETAVHRASPPLLKVRAGVLSLPVTSDQIVATGRRQILKDS